MHCETHGASQEKWSNYVVRGGFFIPISTIVPNVSTSWSGSVYHKRWACREVTPVDHVDLKADRTDYRSGVGKIPCRIDPAE